ncbi:hypothetical protein AXF42_Ash016862 [Apostasia shenzhenica]|uniref:Uncharacterized protein n=1 Tax=Apostasia shenzhenica TaxID=1088818 RepID=A0A2I0BAN7_9ASPA|nr:hypothetical protein AXF42_Ash016862 [Apostasia shenzhenica]
MAKRAVRYAVVDAFTDTPFKGNPAAVCFLGEEEEADDEWMQAVAKEFNISETAFLIPSASSSGGSAAASLYPRFLLRWFTPVAEVNLCGHATLASAHFLFTSGAVQGALVEFDTRSGTLTTKKVEKIQNLGSLKQYIKGDEQKFSIELDFPIIEVRDCDSTDIPSIPLTLNGLSTVNVQKTVTTGDPIGSNILVELSSGKDLANIKPDFGELERCSGRGFIMTALAPPGTGFDFFTRFFCPKLGINEDPVCGSAHCALAPYWSRKLGKHKLRAYQASPRGGILDLEVDGERKRVLIRGEAVTVMTGTLLA